MTMSRVATLQDVLRLVRSNDANIYFRQSVPSVYGPDNPTIAYVYAMKGYFTALGEYEKLYYEYMDAVSREELVMRLAGQAVKIQRDISIPRFGNCAVKYDTKTIAAALSAGNFKSDCLNYVRDTGNKIKAYASGHMVTGRRDVFITRMSFDGNAVVCSMNDEETGLGDWHYDAPNLDISQILANDIATQLVRSYQNFVFHVADNTVCKDMPELVLDVKFALDRLYKDRDAHDNVLSGKCSMGDIERFMRSSDTVYSLIEFEDPEGAMHACYGIVYNVKGTVHIIPAVVLTCYDGGELYDLLEAGVMHVVTLNDNVVRCIDLSISAKVKSWRCSSVDNMLAAQLREYLRPVKTAKQSELHDELDDIIRGGYVPTVEVLDEGIIPARVSFIRQRIG